MKQQSNVFLYNSGICLFFSLESQTDKKQRRTGQTSCNITRRFSEESVRSVFCWRELTPPDPKMDEWVVAAATCWSSVWLDGSWNDLRQRPFDRRTQQNVEADEPVPSSTRPIWRYFRSYKQHLRRAAVKWWALINTLRLYNCNIFYGLFFSWYADAFKTRDLNLRIDLIICRKDSDYVS